MMPFTADPYPSHRLPCQADHHLRRSQACRQENCSWRSREQLAGPESTPDKILAHAPNSPMAGEQAVFLLGPLEANRAPSSGRGPSLGEIRLRKLPACPPGPCLLNCPMRFPSMTLVLLGLEVQEALSLIFMAVFKISWHHMTFPSHPSFFQFSLTLELCCLISLRF